MAKLEIAGRVVEVDDSFLQLSPEDQQKTVNDIAAKIGASAQPSGPKDTSFSSAFKFGADQPLENMGTSMEAAGQAVGSENLQQGGKYLKDLTQAPENYDPATPRFINPQPGDFTIGGFGVGSFPRAVAEQAGQIGGSLASRSAGAAAGGAIGSLAGPGGTATGAVTGAFAGPALFEFVQQVGPLALERAKNNNRTEPTWDDWSAAAAGAGVSGALNAIGIKGLGGLNSTITKTAIKEGVTEAAQSGIEQTTATAGTEAGLSVDPRQVVGEGLLGAGSAGAIQTGVKAAVSAKAAASGVNAPPKVMDRDAAVSIAKRLITEAQGNELDLKDTERTSPNGAALAADNVHTQLSSEINQIFTELKGVLGGNSRDLRVVLDKALSRSGKRDAGNKVKNVVAPQEIEAVASLELKDRDGNPMRLGDTDIGKELIFRLKESNELTRLIRPGLQGGVSRFTDLLNPIQLPSRYKGDGENASALKLALTGLGAYTNPAITAAQFGAVGAGRAIDALTGRKSRVDRFAKAYGDQDFEAPANRASKSFFEERAAAQQALRDAKSAADAAKAQARLDKLQIKADAQAQKAIEKAQLQAEAQRLNQQSVEKRQFDQALSQTQRIMRVRAALQKQRQKALDAEKKATTATEKAQAAKAVSTVAKREAVVDAAVKVTRARQKLAEPPKAERKKSDRPSFMSDADKALLASEGGNIRNREREQRGTENIQAMQNEALVAADNYSDPSVGAAVRQAVEMLRDNARGKINNQKRIKIYQDLINSVPEAHKPFVKRYVRALGYVFDRD